MTRLSLIALASTLAISAANAQQPTSKPAMDPGMHMKMMMPMNSDSAATKGYKQSMMTMMSGMPAYTGDADDDFMKQMKGHHQAAIDMAKVDEARTAVPSLTHDRRYAPPVTVGAAAAKAAE